MVARMLQCLVHKRAALRETGADCVGEEIEGRLWAFTGGDRDGGHIGIANMNAIANTIAIRPAEVIEFMK
jgi:hypothetical protein